MDNKYTQIDKYLAEYEQINVYGTTVNCPYWMNKMRSGKVILRGFKDGKGTLTEITEQLQKKAKERFSFREQTVDYEKIRKLAKRERIGIDCSGFAYRLLSWFIKHKIINPKSTLEEKFIGGITKTNADMITSLPCSIKIKHLPDYRCGDLVRMMGGKHILIIININQSEIIYAHSSHLTNKQGVHRGSIMIKNINRPLEKQQWLEETTKGDSFGKKYFHPRNSDGVYRLT